MVDYTRDDVTDGTRRWDLVLDAGGHRPLSRCAAPSPPRERWSSSAARAAVAGWGGFDRNLRAVLLSRFVSQRLRMLSSSPGQQDLQTLRELAEAGKLTPVIDRTYPLAEVPAAIRHLAAGHVRGKLVITV